MCGPSLVNLAAIVTGTAIGLAAFLVVVRLGNRDWWG